jgi:predicted GH43/DUF377 family glycosyl hydrolase
MYWEKLGLVFNANKRSDWIYSRAFLPTPILLSKEVIRVYCSFLDEKNRGRVGFVDVSSSDPRIVLGISNDPVLDIGDQGDFDENGVNPSCLVLDSEKVIMYYQGWGDGDGVVPYKILTGCAVSYDDGATFKKLSKLPILPSTNFEGSVRSAPFVIKDDDQNWNLWYSAGSEFIEVNGRQVPFYGIVYSKSERYDEFKLCGTTCVSPLKNSDVFGYARAWVIKGMNEYHIWYSERSATVPYKIKYAKSLDGVVWSDAENLIASPIVSKEGWDSDMVAFPAVISTEFGTYMFYNGNGYGASGFGVARLHGEIK